MKKLLTKTLLICSLAIPSIATDFVFIGSGSVTGNYYPVAGAICYMLNKKRKENNLRCSVESTAGSTYNVQAILDNDLSMGMVQSDVQFYAEGGTQQFKAKGPSTNLRSLFSLYVEPLTLVVRADSGIKTLDDLQGKRVNIGNDGSGQRSIMDRLIKAKGWSYKSFSKVTELKAGAHNDALCNNEIDAFVYAIGHPSEAIKEVTELCDSRLVSLDGEVTEKLIKETSYFAKTTIPGGMYKNNPQDVTTFGVAATLTSSTALSDKIAYTIVKTIFEDIDTLKKLNPVLSNLNPRQMVVDSLSADLHDGATKYYEENNWFDYGTFK
jgi:TRAP transporter TAXI family solute receptor